MVDVSCGSVPAAVPRPARGPVWIRATAAVTALALLAGCGNPDNTTSAEGAGIGAVLGAGLGYALGGKQGALIGAGLGAGVGFIGAHYVNTKRRDYANNEDRIASEQRIAQANIKAIDDYNQQITHRIADLDNQAAQLRHASAQGENVQAQLLLAQHNAASQTKDLQAKLADADKAVAESERNLSIARSTATPADREKLAALKAEVEQLQSANARLKEKADELMASERNLFLRHHGSRPVVRTIAVLGCALGLAGCQAGDPHSDDLFGGIAGISGGYQQRAQEQQRQLNLTNQYLAGQTETSHQLYSTETQREKTVKDMQNAVADLQRQNRALKTRLKQLAATRTDMATQINAAYAKEAALQADLDDLSRRAASASADDLARLNRRKEELLDERRRLDDMVRSIETRD